MNIIILILLLCVPLFYKLFQTAPSDNMFFGIYQFNIFSRYFIHNNLMILFIKQVLLPKCVQIVNSSSNSATRFFLNMMQIVRVCDNISYMLQCHDGPNNPRTPTTSQIIPRLCFAASSLCCFFVPVGLGMIQCKCCHVVKREDTSCDNFLSGICSSSCSCILIHFISRMLTGWRHWLTSVVLTVWVTTTLMHFDDRL